MKTVVRRPSLGLRLLGSNEDAVQNSQRKCWIVNLVTTLALHLLLLLLLLTPKLNCC